MSTPKKQTNIRQAAMDDVEVESIEGLVLEELLGYALRRAQLKVFQHFNEAMREHDIRPAQFSALVLIEGYPGVTQSSLAQALNIDPPRVVSLINNLEERGLAMRVRCKKDRRSHGIFLTKQGEALVDRLKEISLHSDKTATQALSEVERRQLLQLLHKIYTPDPPKS